MSPARAATLVDPELPHLYLAASPTDLAALFEEHVLPSLLPDGAPVQTHIADVTYTPGRRCTILCVLEPLASSEPPTRVVVSMAAPGRVETIYEQRYGSGSDGSGTLVRDRELLIEVFPADWALPTLGSAVDLGQMTPVIQACSAEPRSYGAPGSLTIDLLHYRPHRRAVLRYGATDGVTTRPELVGKLYRTATEAADAWNRLTTAHAALRDTGTGVPAPLKLLRPQHLLLMAHEGGTPLKELLQPGASSADSRQGVARAGVALARLHHHQPPDAEVRDVSTELQRLRRRAESVHTVAPDLARRIQHLLDEITAGALRLHAGPQRFIHGDFTPSQLLMGDGETVLVDFDLAGPGDPAIDVANFTTKLLRRARRSGEDEYRTLAAAFLTEYRRHAPDDPDLPARVKVLENIALVRTAVRAFRHAPFAGAVGAGMSLASQFLDEAELSLSPGDPRPGSPAPR